MLTRASAAVVDPTTSTTQAELGAAVERLGVAKVLVVVPRDYPRTLPDDQPRIPRPSPGSESQLAIFTDRIRNFARMVAQDFPKDQRWESRRLLEKREWRAAVVSAITALDACVRTEN